MSNFEQAVKQDFETAMNERRPDIEKLWEYGVQLAPHWKTPQWQAMLNAPAVKADPLAEIRMKICVELFWAHSSKETLSEISSEDVLDITHKYATGESAYDVVDEINNDLESGI